MIRRIFHFSFQFIGVLAVGFAIAEGTRRLCNYFERERPDLLVLLGDRYEMLAGANAAMGFNIPVAHIYGGAVTEGAIDELVSTGVLDDPTSGKDSLDHQLEQVSASASVESELAAIRGSLPSAERKSLPEGQS